MQPVNKEKKCKWLERTCFCMFFLVAFFLCRLIEYSDGDDAYFYQMAHSMGFFEYLKMRYITWEGRMTSEAMTYISMYLGKEFWNVANAVMLTLLPLGMTKIVKKVYPDMKQEQKTFVSIFFCVGILLMGLGVVGYASFWITGSTFYLWSVVAGVWSAIPLAAMVFSPEELSWKSFLYSIPCGFIASMGLEQITAVVITFGVIALIWCVVTKKKICIPAVVQIVIMIVGFALLYLSPGTEMRTSQEVRWMPEFENMSIPHHIFITVQWLLSGFANYHKNYVSIILILLMVLQVQKKKEQQSITNKIDLKVAIVAAVAGTVSAWISMMGCKVFTELGIGLEDEMIPVTKTATLQDLTGQEIFACFWQILLIVLVLYLLWKTGSNLREKSFWTLIFLASLASGAVMYFSPTIYASGPRVMFVTAVMQWLLIGVLFSRIKNWKMKCILVAVVLVTGVGNVVPYVLGK